MKDHFKSLQNFKATFNSEKYCFDYLFEARWPLNIFCPHCESFTIYSFNHRRRFKCLKCKRGFSLRTETIFQDSNLPLRKWFILIYLLSNGRTKFSSTELAKEIRVSQKTAWYMMDKIIGSLGATNPEFLARRRRRKSMRSRETKVTFIGHLKLNKVFREILPELLRFKPGNNIWKD